MTVSGEELATAATWTWHQDPRWGFQFLYPEGWRRFAFGDGREGVLYSPEPEDGTTGLGVEVKELGFEVTKEDLPDLEAGFREGRAALPYTPSARGKRRASDARGWCMLASASASSTSLSRGDARRVRAVAPVALCHADELQCRQGPTDNSTKGVSDATHERS